jgi:hypothetical protein
MITPVLPAVAAGDDMMTGTLSVNGNRFVFSSVSSFKEIASEVSASLERRSPILTVDVDGFNRRIVNNALISKTKTRRSEHWVLTGVTVIDDVFDAFHMGADTLLIPYHNVSPNLLKEINDISDCCIPVIMTNGMSSFSVSGNESIIDSMRNVQRCGSPDVIVLNTSEEDIWDDILKENERTIPLVFGNASKIIEKGFSDVLEVLSQVHTT